MIVLRSTPKLVATSLCERPAYQWTKISVTSVTSNVLLAISPPGTRREPRKPVRCEDLNPSDTLTLPVGNYVSDALRNYVSENPSDLVG